MCGKIPTVWTPSVVDDSNLISGLQGIQHLHSTSTKVGSFAFILSSASVKWCYPHFPKRGSRIKYISFLKVWKLLVMALEFRRLSASKAFLDPFSCTLLWLGRLNSVISLSSLIFKKLYSLCIIFIPLILIIAPQGRRYHHDSIPWMRKLRFQDIVMQQGLKTTLFSAKPSVFQHLKTPFLSVCRQPTPVFLPGKPHGQKTEEPGGLQSMESQKSLTWLSGSTTNIYFIT